LKRNTDVPVISNKFQKVLETKRRQLALSCSNREEIQIENAGDDFERLQQRLNRELAIRNLDRDSKLLKDVGEALSRIETGVFGMCLQCDDEIPDKRLNAVPWASYCVTCQEELDRRRDAGELEGDDDKLSSAA
jgi:DnaK suppressor protein